MAISFEITTPSGEKDLDTIPPTYNVRPIVRFLTSTYFSGTPFLSLYASWTSELKCYHDISGRYSNFTTCRITSQSGSNHSWVGKVQPFSLSATICICQLVCTAILYFTEKFKFDSRIIPIHKNHFGKNFQIFSEICTVIVMENDDQRIKYAIIMAISYWIVGSTYHANFWSFDDYPDFWISYQWIWTCLL